MRAPTFVPDKLLRTIDGVRARRILATTGPATVEYARRYGLRVRRGPFAGLEYPGGWERAIGDLAAKLTAAYEYELHRAAATWIEVGFDHVIDVGCAEGYYAVGFALKMPSTTVHAFDIDPAQRERCDVLASLNGVADRVQIAGELTPADLGRFPEHGVALLSDCEGAERMLLDPARAPRLRGWPLLVELHDFIDPTITETICARFSSTHEIELIESETRDEEPPPELSFASRRQRTVMLSERPPGMRWAHMRPRV
jgi:hypothetical protein